MGETVNRPVTVTALIGTLAAIIAVALTGCHKPVMTPAIYAARQQDTAIAAKCQGDWSKISAEDQQLLIIHNGSADAAKKFIIGYVEYSRNQSSTSQ